MVQAISGAQDGASRAVERSTIAATSLRLIPLLTLAYFLAYLNRVNLSFAALTMNAELQFTTAVFALGAGMFFVGYFLFQVPSNLALNRFGARRWIAIIMGSWGLISALMATVNSTGSFYTLRFLLGVAEAGFFPGVILYLTFWYPVKLRARIFAAFTVAVPVSTVVGAPVSSLILLMDGVAGLQGWQWLFILEGLPSILLGIFTWFYLSDRPEQASWLTAEQKQWLTATLDAERAEREARHDLTVLDVMKSPRVLQLGFVYFGYVAAHYGMQFWLPTFVKSLGPSNLETGFLTAIPYLLAAVLMILWARRSDQTGERLWHIAFPLLVTSVALAICAFVDDTLLTMTALSVAAIGVFCTFAVFWTIPTEWLSGAALAAGLALINALGSAAGMVGPYLVAWITDHTDDLSNGLLLLAALPLMSAMVLMVGGPPGGSELEENERKAAKRF